MRLWHRTECQSDRFLRRLAQSRVTQTDCGPDVDREQLLQELIVSFKKYYELTREGAYGDISELYFMNLYHRDGYYRFRDKEGEFEGRIFGVEDDGRLLLHDRQGCIREYSFKEVEFMIPAAQ